MYEDDLYMNLFSAKHALDQLVQNCETEQEIAYQLPDYEIVGTETDDTSI